MKDTSEITRDVLRRRDDWQQERSARHRSLMRTMAVVLVVLTLCGGAAAAGSNALADFFVGFRGGDLSPEQEAVATLAEDFEARTAVSGDWTVTIDNTICDGQNYFMTVSVTGPEGWMEGIGGVHWEEMEIIGGGKLHKHREIKTWHELEPTEADTDRYVMCISLEETVEGPLTLELKELRLLRGKEADIPPETEEVWIFEDLEFANAGEPVELLAEPIVVHPLVGLDEERCKVQFDSIQLRAFSICISYSHMDLPGVPDPEGLLVLKDGSSYELSFSGGGGSEGGMLNAVFGFPVLPEEVDHILIEGIRFDIP